MFSSKITFQKEKKYNETKNSLQITYPLFSIHVHQSLLLIFLFYMHLVIFFDSIETNKEVQSLFNQGEEWDEECNKRT